MTETFAAIWKPSSEKRLRRGRRTNAASVKTFVSFACCFSRILETGGLSLPLKQRAFRYPSLSMQARTTDATLLATVTLSSSDRIETYLHCKAFTSVLWTSACGFTVQGECQTFLKRALNPCCPTLWTRFATPLRRPGAAAPAPVPVPTPGWSATLPLDH